MFILLELPALGRSILGLLYPDSADRATRIAADVNVTIARWVAGTLIVATIAGVSMYIACTIVGVPFAIVLALLVAVFDLIPLVGATIGAIVVVAVAFTQGVTEGVVMLIFSLVYQQVENQIIQPIVMKRSGLGLALHRADQRADRLVAARHHRRAARDPLRRLDPDRAARGASRPAARRCRARASGWPRPTAARPSRSTSRWSRGIPPPGHASDPPPPR